MSKQSGLCLLTMCLLCSCTVTETLYYKHSFSVAPRPQGRSVFSTRRTPEDRGDASPEINGATAPCYFGEAITIIKTTDTMKIITQWNYLGPIGEVNNEESLTVPGEAYTIPQLMERVNGGIPLNTLVDIKEDHFASDADFDTFVPEADYDLVDAMEHQQQSAEIIADAQERLTKAEKEKVSPTLESDEGENEGSGIPDPATTKKVAKSGGKTPQPDD